MRLLKWFRQIKTSSVLAWRRYRFARECAKLDPREEIAMAEEGMAWELELWDEY